MGNSFCQGCTFPVKIFQVWPHEKHLKTHSPCILFSLKHIYLPEVPIPASLPASIDLCRQTGSGTFLPGAGAVQSSRQGSQAWQEMLAHSSSSTVRYCNISAGPLGCCPSLAEMRRCGGGSTKEDWGVKEGCALVTGGVKTIHQGTGVVKGAQGE